MNFFFFLKIKKLSASIFSNFHFYWLWLCEHEIWWKHREQMPTNRSVCAESGLKADCVWVIVEKWCLTKKKEMRGGGKMRDESVDCFRYVDFVGLTETASAVLRVLADIRSESESQQEFPHNNKHKRQQQQRQHFSYSLIHSIFTAFRLRTFDLSKIWWNWNTTIGNMCGVCDVWKKVHRHRIWKIWKLLRYDFHSNSIELRIKKTLNEESKQKMNFEWKNLFLAICFAMGKNQEKLCMNRYDIFELLQLKGRKRASKQTELFRVE